MSSAWRWLFILGVLLLGVSRAASVEAHPLLEDALNVTLGADSIQLDLRTTLRPVVVASAATPHDGSYFALPEMRALVQAHAGYIARHLTLRCNAQPLVARALHGELAADVTAPIQAHVDLERSHALFSLSYPPCALPHWSLEQDMLSDAPEDRAWHLSYIVTVRRSSDNALLASGLLTQERGFDFEADAPTASAAREIPRGLWGYFLAGIRHILGGWDHLLFVSALVLAVRRLSQLIQVVLAFTVAHTCTLTLAVLHWIRVPTSLVEPLIAVSIVAVSLDNLLRPERSAGAPRLVFAFGFGLIHGLGFAGPLVDALTGAPPSAVAIGILGFSAGVELGHQLIVLPLFAAVTRLARTTHERSFAVTLRLGSLATAFGGAFFLVRALRTFVLT